MESPGSDVCSFKHALVRDAAYESPLKSRRQQLHGQIARKMEEKLPDIVVSQPEIVAHHFAEAGLVEPAVAYWLKAGNLALSRSANAAVGHLEQGLKLIPALMTPCSATSLSCCFKRRSAIPFEPSKAGVLTA